MQIRLKIDMRIDLMLPFNESENLKKHQVCKYLLKKVLLLSSHK